MNLKRDGTQGKERSETFFDTREGNSKTGRGRRRSAAGGGQSVPLSLSLNRSALFPTVGAPARNRSLVWFRLGGAIQGGRGCPLIHRGFHALSDFPGAP